MKKIVTVLLMTLIISNLFGQKVPKVAHDFSIETSKPYPVVDGNKFYFPSANGEEMYAFKIRKKEIFLQRFSVGGDMIEEGKAVILRDKFALESVEELGGRFYMFYSIYDKSNKIEQLFVREIDFQTLSFKSEGEKILSINGKVSGVLAGTFVSAKITDKFSFIKSDDKSKMLISYRKVPKKKNDFKSYEVLGMTMYDLEFNQLWSKEMEMPYTEEKMTKLDFKISNKGDAYILAMVYNSDKAKRYVAGKINYRIELLKIEQGDITTTIIDVNGKDVRNISLFPTKEGFVCAGFYTFDKENQEADELFILKLSNNEKVRSNKAYPISLEDIEDSKTYTEKERAKRLKNLRKLKVVDARLQKDGSIILVSEQIYFVNDNSKGLVYNYSGYFLITKINAEGEKVWMKRLNKKQMSFYYQAQNKTIGDYSFKYLTSNNYHYFIFSDKVTNLGEDKITSQLGFVSAYKLNDKTGEVTNVPILDNRAVKLNQKDELGVRAHKMDFSKVVILNEKEFILEVYLGDKKDMLIKLKLD